jgi:hypothetical protein
MAMERLPSIMRQIVDRLGSIATGNIVLLSVAALLAIVSTYYPFYNSIKIDV